MQENFRLIFRTLFKKESFGKGVFSERSICGDSRVAIPAAIYKIAPGPGPESAHGVLFESGTWLRVGHFPARASGHSCKWRQGSQF